MDKKTISKNILKCSCDIKQMQVESDEAREYRDSCVRDIDRLKKAIDEGDYTDEVISGAFLALESAFILRHDKYDPIEDDFMGASTYEEDEDATLDDVLSDLASLRNGFELLSVFTKIQIELQKVLPLPSFVEMMETLSAMPEEKREQVVNEMNTATQDLFEEMEEIFYRKYHCTRRNADCLRMLIGDVPEFDY